MKNIFILLATVCAMTSAAQNDRLYVDNNIVWPQLFTSIKLSKNTDWLIEYQWRRTNGLSDWQQSLFRTAVQWKPNSQLAFAAGYGWIETFPYGEFPLAVSGTFPEHRIHEQVQWKQQWNKLSLTQRLRVEQRFIGRRAAGAEREIAEWLFSHRFRHMLRLQFPLSSETNSIYLAAADEIFINAGKNVGANIFDQNRIMLIAGKKLNDHVSLETGFINQTVMQGRRVNEKTIVQNNNGVLLSAYLNF